MRIIAGEAKGRRLKGCKGKKIRPTTDRVKETIFNLIRGMVSGAKVLDLFAGSGNLGLESLSRGARQVTFVDSSPRAVSVIKENIETLGFERRAAVKRDDVFRMISRLGKRREGFNLIFADPPYERGLAQKTIDHLSRSPVLEDGGAVVVEHSKREQIEPKGFRVDKNRNFGDSLVTVLVRKEQ